MKNIEGTAGLFELPTDITIAGSPQELHIHRWGAIDRLGNAEMEEAAARVLSFSLTAGKWVGVTLENVIEQMHGDVKAFYAVQQARQRNWQKRDAHVRNVQLYVLFSVLTLGIYALCAKKPKLELEEEPTPPDCTTLAVVDPRIVMNGLIRLTRQYNLVRAEKDGEGDEARDVLFPTAELVRLINSQGAWRQTALAAS